MTGKNIVLQTSAPVKEKSQKNGGTDNPAFLADNNYVVGSKIVRIPLSSTVIDASGSIGIELSEVDGKQIYTCKQKDGLMGKKNSVVNKLELKTIIIYTFKCKFSASDKFLDFFLFFITQYMLN